MKLIEVELKVKAKLKVAIMILPTLWPTGSLGLPAVDHLVLQAREGLPLGVLMNRAQSGAGQGREPRPGLGFLPWLLTQKYLSKPPLVTTVGAAQYSSPREPQAAVGLRVGGIIIATFNFVFTLSSTSISFMMKCLRYFLL